MFDLILNQLLVERDERYEGLPLSLYDGNKKIPLVNTAQEGFDVIQAAGGQTRPVLPPVKPKRGVPHPDEAWDETITLFAPPDDAA
ncbi:hypothetical protein ELI44_30110 (plasmid) [Rhizobium ruizarguesonis]|uniref:hypothetical protein n=1 Tax=Rhizobium ruizarguesonis TaxID=2081791 RepID=UPI00102F95F6|nr:hypothetical protein [Rhizobium ruizarguesonis]TAU38389.1 hypothetical protein ELI42_30090 [Rhizobium ruizarguesonis]TAU56021.1 hypothetical protein ELI44_30110 [Rhizobium ruizarguesonis]